MCGEHPICGGSELGRGGRAVVETLAVSFTVCIVIAGQKEVGAAFSAGGAGGAET